MNQCSAHRRRVDEMGRVIIPSDLRRECGIDVGDHVDFVPCADGLLLKKHTDRCVFCGGGARSSYLDRPVCDDCLAALRSIV